MERGLDSEDEELGASSGYKSYSVSLDEDGMPAAVNILKPQIDSIFSEVQKNLPTIDFDSSDISSDNDEPIFFHQQLKASEQRQGIDDDKDTDTSCAPNASDTIEGDKNANKAAPSDADDEKDEEDIYDNDLAALLAQTSFPTDEEIKEWREGSDRFEAFQRMDEDASLNDIARSRLLGHISSLRSALQQSPHPASHSTRSTTAAPCSNKTTVAQGTQSDEPVRMEDIAISTNDDDLNEDDADPGLCPLSPDMILKEQLKNPDIEPKERRRLIAEQSRSKDRELASALAPKGAPLSLRLFEHLDLESVLAAAREEGVPVSSLRLVGNPAPTQLPKEAPPPVPDLAEEMTLIQKLAALSLTQRGIDPAQVSQPPVHPRTGAPLSAAGEDNHQEKEASPREKELSKVPNKWDPKSTAKSTSVSSSGTNTANSSAGGEKILWGKVHNINKTTS